MLEKQFTELLGRLHFDDEVLEWMRDALHATHADQRREHKEVIKRHQAEYKRLDDRIRAMYVDKLDGTIEKVQSFATEWLWSYHHERPNMALGGFTPHQRLAMAA